MFYLRIFIFLVLTTISLNTTVKSKEAVSDEKVVLIYAYLPKELKNTAYSHLFPKSITVILPSKIHGYDSSSACEIMLLDIKTEIAKKKLGKELLNNYALYLEAKKKGKLDGYSDYHKNMIKEGALISLEAFKNIDKIKYNYECIDTSRPENILDIRL